MDSNSNVSQSKECLKEECLYTITNSGANGDGVDVLKPKIQDCTTGAPDVGPVPAPNNKYDQSDKRNVNLQSPTDRGTNLQRSYSFNNTNSSGLIADIMFPRNPITGFGLNGNDVGRQRPMKLRTREGNPLTGMGYAPGRQDYIGPANVGMNSHETINMNTAKKGSRVPLGGYSSGLW